MMLSLLSVGRWNFVAAEYGQAATPRMGAQRNAALQAPQGRDAALRQEQR
ncbi:hypothetical protein [Paraburkholderia sp. RL17-337-BIB-A]|jgi:hypothetical protein